MIEDNLKKSENVAYLDVLDNVLSIAEAPILLTHHRGGSLRVDAGNGERKGNLNLLAGIGHSWHWVTEK
jgi:hypothetical protein